MLTQSSLKEEVVIKRHNPLLFLIIIIFTGCTHQQKIVVSSHPSSSDAEVILYQKEAFIWLEKNRFQGVIGRNGSSLHKQEGDGKTPQGIYPLSHVFGSFEYKGNLPFLPLSSEYRCVDDSHSRYYNAIISTKTTMNDYHSFEEMNRSDGLYNKGIVIDYNPQRLPLKGSCIFFHIAKEDFTPTAGCVALREKDLSTIIEWLNKDLAPMVEIR